MNECDDDETPARILYTLLRSVCVYIEVSLKLCSLFKIYIYIYTHTTSSSFVFLGLLLLRNNNSKKARGITLKSSIRVRGFVRCFSPKFTQREREKKRETFCSVFFSLNVLRVSNPNFTTERKKERKKERVVIRSLFSERKIIKKRLSLRSLSLVSVITRGNVFVRSCDVHTHAR